MKPYFKVGDLVRVKIKEEVRDLKTSPIFVSSMFDYCGKIYEVRSVNGGSPYHYNLKGCSDWNFSENVLEPVIIDGTWRSLKVGDVAIIRTFDDVKLEFCNDASYGDYYVECDLINVGNGYTRSMSDSYSGDLVRITEISRSDILFNPASMVLFELISSAREDAPKRSYSWNLYMFEPYGLDSKGGLPIIMEALGDIYKQAKWRLSR